MYIGYVHFNTTLQQSFLLKKKKLCLFSFLVHLPWERFISTYVSALDYVKKKKQAKRPESSASFAVRKDFHTLFSAKDNIGLSDTRSSESS